LRKIREANLARSGKQEGEKAGNGLREFSLSHSKQQNRFRMILEKLQRVGEISVEDLKEELGMSVVTIRRDLDLLAEQGRLSRTHGGAVSIEPLFYEPFKNDRSFVAQVERQAEAKRRIGRAAVALIEPGQTIAITPGTTTAQIIRGLPFEANITIVTNTVNVAMELSKRKDIKVFVTGGHLHGDWFSLVGPTAARSVENILVHTFFIGADGIDATFGPSSFSEEEAEVIAAMARCSRRKIAVVDHTKLGVATNWRICDTTELDLLITDDGATDAAIAPFQKRGIEVRRV